ncbi:MAG: hypothetical protein FJ304_07760 [Planctomycetes bacterium]|nr:hypothetical protein [Planctomycetota bacterium]
MTSDEITKLAFCDVCHQPLTLVDMREQAAARGHQYPDRADSYVVTCDACNCVHRISDPELYFRVVEAIKAHKASQASASDSV